MGVVVPMLATKKLLPLVGSRQRLTTSLIRRSFAGRFFLLAAVLGELENGFDRLQLGEQFTETMIDWDEFVFVHLGAIFFWDRPLIDADNFTLSELGFGGSMWIPWEAIVEP